MANDFVRNIKGVRNINKLSRNITTENDLISTNDNDVYVVTNAGYKKITGGETEKDIELLETDVKKLKTQLDDLESNTKQYYTLFEGSKKGVGSKIPLNDDFHSFHLLYISGEFPGGVFTETILVKALIDNISIQRLNLRDSDGTFLGAYEIKLTPNKNTELEITNDVSWDELGSTGTGADRNAYTITNIEGVK